ncbi:unnamed protein product [Ilex paraguariensis]|uniref:Uncharacterized protein n=1 Tax=Ilex paraguariensis TaxID=185542 RepID=A0ABC8T2P8_9AQUA
MATSLPGDDSAAASGPFLREEVMSLKGLELIAEQAEPAQSAPEPEIASTSSSVQERKPANKKTVKPKWLKMDNHLVVKPAGFRTRVLSLLKSSTTRFD